MKNSHRYWVLRSSTVDTVLSGYSHLIKTRWHQNSPWNQYTPLTEIGGTTRCKVGCVAVAGAQLLYYLHYKINFPVSTYSSCTISGYSNYDGQLIYPHDYSYSFNNYSFSSWNLMARDLSYDSYNISKAATLLAYVGNGVNMKYGENKSSSTHTKLKTFLNNEGLNCTKIEFDLQRAWNYIYNNGIPVVVSAVTPEGSGHVWLMDGARRTTITTTNYYELIELVQLTPNEDLEIIGFVIDEDGNIIETIYADPIINPTVYDTRTEVSTTSSNTYTMNFGSDTPDDYTIFSFSDSWTTQSGAVFSRNKNMIYNFQITN